MSTTSALILQLQLAGIVLAFYLLFSTLLMIHAVTEWHHGYAGLLLMAIAFGITGAGAGAVYDVGAFLVIDDTYQHWRQAHGDATYQSFVHRVGVWLILNVPGMGATSRFLDRLFGRKAC